MQVEVAPGIVGADGRVVILVPMEKEELEFRAEKHVVGYIGSGGISESCVYQV